MNAFERNILYLRRMHVGAGMKSSYHLDQDVKQGDPVRIMSILKLCALSLLLIPLACAGWSEPVPTVRPDTHALDHPQSTQLGRMVERLTPEADATGLSLVETGPEALGSIRSLIALAQSTIDLQYYIWKNDEAGRLVLGDLVRAARRGVRVRLLLDDLEKDWPDQGLMRLGAHPQFEARLFNPFSRETPWLISAFADFRRVTHRMHNKMIVADNAIAIMGGRNVGNAYFSTDEEFEFRDLDIHVAGAAVRDLSHSFDQFWNSDWAVSAETLSTGETPRFDPKEGPDNLLGIAGLEGTISAEVEPPILDDGRSPVAYLNEVLSSVVWTKDVTVLADRPNKSETADSELLDTLVEKITSPERELVLETAFFIPGEEGTEAICALVRSGVYVRLLTNSFSSIDAVTAYAGYRKYREAILRCGVDLYEFRPTAEGMPPKRSLYGSDTSSILHTKAALIDGRYVFIGSFNFDPRSIHLNTEIALLIDSPGLAEKVRQFMDQAISPDNAYALSLEDGDVIWTTVQDGNNVRLRDEPEIDPWDSFMAGFINLLPIQKQL